MAGLNSISHLEAPLRRRSDIVDACPPVATKRPAVPSDTLETHDDGQGRASWLSRRQLFHQLVPSSTPFPPGWDSGVG
jgi:hypothetical protein